MNFSSYILSAVRSLPAKGRRNGIKILTLGLGLAVGLELLTKVCLEQTFDSYFTHADRICYVGEDIIQDGQEKNYDQTSGGIAPRMKEYFPEVEEATRWIWLQSEAKLSFKDSQEKVGADMVILADSCFFNILDRPCLAGNIKEVLGIKGNAVISTSMARKIAKSHNLSDAAKEVLGRKFSIEGSGNYEATIAGVYEDYPLNSSYRPDVVVALKSIGDFGRYDGSDRVMGNDGYKTLLRLSEGSSIDNINARMSGFVKEYLPVEDIKKAGLEFSYTASPYESYHIGNSDIHGMLLMLTLVAVALLLTSVLNYLLIVISNTIVRGKEMALRKCLGSGRGEMFKMMAAESLVHTILSCLFAAVILLILPKLMPNIVSMEDIAAQFSGKPLAIAIIVVLSVFVINTIIPATMYNRIPVASAFRNYRASKRVWKLGLLAVEFGAVGFLGVLIGILTLQYNKLAVADLGFNCSNTAIVNIETLDGSQKKAVLNEIRSQAGVEDATLCYGDPFVGYSGNNVMLPNDIKELFNCADAYWNDGHWFDVMGIHLVKGHNFTEGRMHDEEVIIDTRFEEKLKLLTGWEDVLGKNISITEHNTDKDGKAVVSTIIGVFDNIYQGYSVDDDTRPMAVFYLSPEFSCRGLSNIIVQYGSISPECLSATKAILDKVAPDMDLQVIPLRDENLDQFRDTLNVRNTILIGGIVTLLIAIIGLIGYTIDEVKRRSKEIAIRRINGAQFSEIRRMFIGDLMKIAIPSVITGCILAGLAASRWEQQFTLQAGLPWWVFALAFVITLSLISLLSDVYVRKVAGNNPAESIKTE